MKRAKLLLTTALTLLVSQLSLSQVGIGTTAPSAKLDIDASTLDAIPALRLRPVTTTPTGTVSGQISFIDNSLYLYDTSRSKWLSSETFTLVYSNSGETDNEYLNINEANTGIKIPYNATLIAVTARASGFDDDNDNSRGFRIRKNGSNTNLYGFTIASSLNFTSTTQNLNFDAGDFITVFVDNEADGGIEDPCVTLWLKWRK